MSALPPICVTQTHVVETVTQRNDLQGVQGGDICVVMSTGRSYIYASRPTTRWIEMANFEPEPFYCGECGGLYRYRTGDHAPGPNDGQQVVTDGDRRLDRDHGCRSAHPDVKHAQLTEFLGRTA
jgi:hypothetical protein